MYIDLTHEFSSSMPVFPGDSAPELVKTTDVFKDGISDYSIKTGMHIGTHIDAPGHMLEGGKTLQDYPVSRFFGRGIIIDARGKASAGIELLTSPSLSLEKRGIRRGDIVLVCFGWSSEFRNDEYYLNYPLVTESFAKRLTSLGVSILGLDTPSPDRAPYPVHKILFKQGILIIENLTNLEALIGKGPFEIIALPSKFATDAAPVRVVAKRIY